MQLREYLVTMRCSVHNRHSNQWQELKLDVLIPSTGFSTSGQVTPHIPSVQALQTKLRSYLTWMAHNKMQSSLRKLNKWVTELTFAKAKVLTPRSYQQGRGDAGIEDTQASPVCSQQTQVHYSRQRAQRTQREKRPHQNTRKKSAKGLILLACFIQLP